MAGFIITALALTLLAFAYNKYSEMKEVKAEAYKQLQITFPDWQSVSEIVTRIGHERERKYWKEGNHLGTKPAFSSFEPSWSLVHKALQSLVRRGDAMCDKRTKDIACFKFVEK